VVPSDYARAYYRGRGAEILVLVDATDPILARAVRASANGLMERHNQRLQRFEVGPDGGALRASEERASFGVEADLIQQKFLRFAVLNLYNPELRTPVFVVPALLGVILTTTMILMTALAIVRERERGSYEFLIATPIRRTELMAGKLIPYIGIGFLQIVIVVVTGLVLFKVPVVGSLFDLAVVSLVFIAANLTLGLVISSVTSSQFQATQLSFFFFLPSVLLSGFMFPFEAMPRPAQWLGEPCQSGHPAARLDALRPIRRGRSHAVILCHRFFCRDAAVHQTARLNFDSERANSARVMLVKRKTVHQHLSKPLVGILVLVLLATSCRRSNDLKVGDVIPAFELSTLSGELVSSQSFLGRPVVLNFWATWCGPCVKEIPTLKTLDQDATAQVVTIAIDEQGANAVRPFVDGHEIDYTVLLGDKETFQRFKGWAIPYTLVLDASLQIVSLHRGYVSLRSLERDLRRAES